MGATEAPEVAAERVACQEKGAAACKPGGQAGRRSYSVMRRAPDGTLWWGGFTAGVWIN